MGCGPGRASLVIADELPDATITAVDLYQPYLDQLVESARAAGAWPTGSTHVGPR
ncbi:MAG: class I SAM-dependent methyltransferase [Ilumatobacteraceae bacterium]